MQILYLVVGLAMLPFFMDQAFAQQVVSVNQTTACFLNYTAGLDLWENCGLDEDYLQTALLPWEWITGGNFSLVIVSIFTLVSYIKYHKAIYPIIIGIMYVPIAYFVFPDTFLSFAFLMTGVTIGILVWYIIIHQTKEYNG